MLMDKAPGRSLFTELDLYARSEREVPIWEAARGKPSSFDPRVLFDEAMHVFTLADSEGGQTIPNCTLLCSMLTPVSSVDCWSVQNTKWIADGKLRHEAWHLYAFGKVLPDYMRRKLQNDASYVHVRDFIDSIDREQFELLPSEVPMLGKLGVNHYGVIADLLVRDKNTNQCGGFGYECSGKGSFHRTNR